MGVNEGVYSKLVFIVRADEISDGKHFFEWTEIHVIHL